MGALEYGVDNQRIGANWSFKTFVVQVTYVGFQSRLPCTELHSCPCAFASASGQRPGTLCRASCQYCAATVTRSIQGNPVLVCPLPSTSSGHLPFLLEQPRALNNYNKTIRSGPEVYTYVGILSRCVGSVRLRWESLKSPVDLAVCYAVSLRSFLS